MNDRHPIVATDGRYDYRVMELIGHEPGGELYLGEAIGRGGAEPVSIRTFSDRDLVDSRFRDRLLEAVKLHRALQHPAIHPIRSFIELHHAPAIVSAPIEGRRLADLLRDGPLPIRAAAAMVEQLAAGLHALHAAGVGGVRPLGRTHQDIHPDTILLSHDGQSCLLEVGTARARIALDRPDITGQPPVPGYVAPERRGGTKGRDRPESDVYGLAIVLLQALSGLHPEPLPDDPEAHAEATRSALAGLADVPDPIRGLLGEMLAYDPDDRPAAREVARRLRALVPDLSGPWLSAWTGERIAAPAPQRPQPPTEVYAEVEDDAQPTEENTKQQAAASRVEALRPLRKATAEERTAKRRRAAVATAGWILAGAGLCTALYIAVMQPQWIADWAAIGGSDGEKGSSDASGEEAAPEAPTRPPDPPDLQVVEIDPDDASDATPVPAGATANVNVVGVEGELPDAPPGSGAVAPPPEDAPDVIVRVVDRPEGPEPPPEAPPAPPTVADEPLATAPPAPPPLDVALAPPPLPALEPAAAAQPDGPEVPAGILASTRAEPTREVPYITRRQLQRKVRSVAPEPAFGENPDRAAPNARQVFVEVFAPMAEAVTMVCANGARAAEDGERTRLERAPVGRCDVQAIVSGKAVTGTFQLDGDRRVECRVDFATKLRCW